MGKGLRGDYSSESLQKTYEQCQDLDLKAKLLALKMVYSGKKVTEVAKDLGLSYKTVYNWIDRWNESGIEGLKARKRGKPKADYLKNEEWLEIIEEIKGRGYNLEQVREYIHNTRGVKYSYQGVWASLIKKLKVPYGKHYVLNGKHSTK